MPDNPWTWVIGCYCTPLLMAFAMGWAGRVIYVRRKKIVQALKDREPAE